MRSVEGEAAQQKNPPFSGPWRPERLVGLKNRQGKTAKPQERQQPGQL